MSALGQTRRFAPPPMTSGLPPEADIVTAGRHVSKVPPRDLLERTEIRTVKGGPSSKRHLHGGVLHSALEALKHPQDNRTDQKDYGAQFKCRRGTAGPRRVCAAERRS